MQPTGTNPQFFRFRQFLVKQDHSPWKVGIDSILLGSWVGAKGRKRILDAGAGTAVLSLMVSQRSRGQITAVEVDIDAADEARENVRRSPWPRRIEVVCSDLREFASLSEQMYDLIISNPPYFGNDQSISHESRSLARTGSGFDLRSLPDIASGLLTANGVLATVVPHRLIRQFISKCNASGLFVMRRTNVRHSSIHNWSLALVELSRNLMAPKQNELILYDGNGKTRQFQELTEDFYV